MTGKSWTVHPLTVRLLRSYFLGFPVQRGKTRLRAWYQSILKQAGQVVVHLEGPITISLDINEPMQRMLFFRGVYHKEEELFRALLETSMTVLDAGANIGLYTLIAAARIGSSGRVHAFEPAPENFLKLQENIQRNRLTNVVANRIALSDKAESTDLYLAPAGNCGKHSLRPIHGYVGKTVVKGISLDEYLKQSGVETVDLVKIDVEGAELMVLRGSNQMLSSGSEPIIFCEASDINAARFGYSSGDLKHHLRGYGYRGFRYERDRLTAVDHEIGHKCENIIFLRENHFARHGILKDICP